MKSKLYELIHVEFSMYYSRFPTTAFSKWDSSSTFSNKRNFLIFIKRFQHLPINLYRNITKDNIINILYAMPLLRETNPLKRSIPHHPTITIEESIIEFHGYCPLDTEHSIDFQQDNSIQLLPISPAIIPMIALHRFPFYRSCIDSKYSATWNLYVDARDQGINYWEATWSGTARRCLAKPPCGALRGLVSMCQSTHDRWTL